MSTNAGTVAGLLRSSAVPTPAVPAVPRRRRLAWLRRPAAWVASWIPFTDAFQDQARAEVSRPMRVFRRLAVIEPRVRKALEPRVQEAEETMARMRIRMRVAVFAVVAFSTVALGYCLFYFIPSRFIALEPLLADGGLLARYSLLLYAPVVATLAVAADLATHGYRAMQEKFGRRAARVLGGTALSLLATWLALRGVQSLLVAPTVDLGLYLAVFWLSLVLALVATALPTRAVLRRLIEFYGRRASLSWPEAAVVHELLTVLVRLEETRGRDRWLDLEVRRELVECLERAAATIECSLPRRLRHADADTHAWLAGETRGIAASLRELKRDLCLPRAGVVDDVREAVAAALVSVAGGDWSRLERREEEAEDAVAASAAPKRPAGWKLALLRALAVVAVTGGLAFLVGRAPESVLTALDKIFTEVYGLVLPLVAPIVAYTVLKAINPSTADDLPAIRQLGKKE